MIFGEYINYVRSMGESSGAFRDVNLSFYSEGGREYSAADYFNIYYKKRSDSIMTYHNILGATVSYLCSFLNNHNLTFNYINSFQDEKEKLKAILMDFQVLTIAITTTYYVSHFPISEIIDFIKNYNKRAKIIIGGPYLITQYEILDKIGFQYLLKQIGADFYVKNYQGEKALVNIIKAIKNHNNYDSIDNIIYSDGSDYLINKFSFENNKLEDNFINWSLFKDDFSRNKWKMVAVRTSISCPFSCFFCSFPSHAGEYRCLSEADLFRELDQINRLKEIKSVTFIDDTFNVPLNRFRNILSQFKSKNYNFKWNCNYRCQYATEDDIISMKDAGCEGVFLGIESANKTILKNMNKKSKVEDYINGIRLLKKHNIFTYASFIVGFPGETKETIDDTIRFIESTKPDFYRAQLWYYDTMTPIDKLGKKFGLLNSQFEWKHNTMDSKIAADWVDYMHESIKNSVWLPQNDFDYPGIINLLSRGWSLDEIKVMLKEFNKKVSKKIAFSDCHARTRIEDNPLYHINFNF